MLNFGFCSQQLFSTNYLCSLAKILWFCLAVTVSQFVTADEIEERGAFGNTNPPFKRIGCPAVQNFQDEGAVKHDTYCFFQNTSCVPNKLDFPDVPKNNNVYKDDTQAKMNTMDRRENSYLPEDVEEEKVVMRITPRPPVRKRPKSTPVLDHVSNQLSQMMEDKMR